MTAARYPFPVAEHTFDIAGRTWTISAVRDQNALLAASDGLATFPFGLMLWESAPVLAAALAARPELVQGKRVLELGAGVGLCGLVAQHLGAALVRQTDHSAEAITLCRVNAARNRVAGIEAEEADWADWRDPAVYDVIIGSDVLYDRAAHVHLSDVLGRSLALGGCVLIADPCRSDTPAWVAQMRGRGWQVSTTDVSTLVHRPMRAGESVTVRVIEAMRV